MGKLLGKLFGGRGIVTKEEVLKDHTEKQINEEVRIIRDTNTNIFKGKIVTQDMQHRFLNSKKSSNTMSIFDIINDPNFEDKFDKYEFPTITEMDDGGKFFQPIMKVISPLATKYVKFFSLTNDMCFSNDHAYDFARLHEDGYLMKVEISRHFDKIMGFEIRYLTPVMDVEVSSMFAPSTTGAKITDAQVSAIPVKKYCVAPFNPAQHLQLQHFLYHPEVFIENYLQDVQEA